MKKIIATFVLILILGGITVFGLTNRQNADKNQEYLRIHIRANSNCEIDQSVKYEVKDAVVETMIPLLSNCKTKQEAESVISNNLGKIEETANKILKKNGFSYVSSAKLATEEFPTRKYDCLVLEQGFYDALILNLGSGEGNNWWCVVYPPLCFLESAPKGQNVVYKSKLVEIIKSFFD